MLGSRAINGRFATAAQILTQVRPDGIAATLDALADDLAAKRVPVDRVILGSAVPGFDECIAVFVELTVAAASVPDAHAATSARLRAAGIRPAAIHARPLAA